MSTTNTAANAIEIAADAFAEWVCNTIENKISEGRALGLSEDEIVAGTRSAMLTFLAGR